MGESSKYKQSETKSADFEKIKEEEEETFHECISK